MCLFGGGCLQHFFFFHSIPIGSHAFLCVRAISSASMAFVIYGFSHIFAQYFIRFIYIIEQNFKPRGPGIVCKKGNEFKIAFQVTGYAHLYIVSPTLCERLLYHYCFLPSRQAYEEKKSLYVRYYTPSAQQHRFC